MQQSHGIVLRPCRKTTPGRRHPEQNDFLPFTNVFISFWVRITDGCHVLFGLKSQSGVCTRRCPDSHGWITRAVGGGAAV